jgi:hypothetical protein
VLLVMAASGCAGGAERAVLDQFFAASRLRDLTALEKVSAVIFEPRQDGTVLAYDLEWIRKTGEDSEEVLINATVRRPSGRTERRPLLVTLKRTPEGLRVAAVRVSTESRFPGFQRR